MGGVGDGVVKKVVWSGILLYTHASHSRSAIFEDDNTLSSSIPRDETQHLNGDLISASSPPVEDGRLDNQPHQGSLLLCHSGSPRKSCAQMQLLARIRSLGQTQAVDSTLWLNCIDDPNASMPPAGVSPVFLIPLTSLLWPLTHLWVASANLYAKCL